MARRYYLPLGATTGSLLLACAAGCTPAGTTAKAKDGPWPGDPVAASPPSGAKVKAGEPELPPDADPAVQPSWYASQALRRSEVALYEHYSKKLRPALDRGKLKTDWESPLASMPAFLTAARTLRVMGEEVLQYDETFRGLAERHKKALARCPPSYRVAANRWREMSAEEKHPLLKGEYAKYAANAETFAVLTEERARAFEKFQGEVAEATRFTRKTVELLSEYEVYVGLAPSLNENDLRRQYRENLKVYVKAFGDFLELHDEWSRTLQTVPLPEKPVDPPPPPAYPQGPPAAVVKKHHSADEKAAIKAATRAGHEYAKAVTALDSRQEFLVHQTAPYVPRPLPKRITDELEWCRREAAWVNAAERIDAQGRGPGWRGRSTADFTPGTYLPLHHATRNTLAGVVQVTGSAERGYSFELVVGYEADLAPGVQHDHALVVVRPAPR